MTDSKAVKYRLAEPPQVGWLNTFTDVTTTNARTASEIREWIQRSIKLSQHQLTLSLSEDERAAINKEIEQGTDILKTLDKELEERVSRGVLVKVCE